jgi:hypothetical protein
MPDGEALNTALELLADAAVMDGHGPAPPPGAGVSDAASAGAVRSRPWGRPSSGYWSSGRVPGRPVEGVDRLRADRTRGGEQAGLMTRLSGAVSIAG